MGTKMSLDGFDRLRTAIVIRAVRDYYNAVAAHREDKIKEVERWFSNSNPLGITMWFNVDGEYILKHIKHMSPEDALKTIKDIEDIHKNDYRKPMVKHQYARVAKIT